jgi:ubiquinone biosynthesis protein
MRIFRPVVRTTLTLQETVRDLGRLREVAGVLVRYGLGALIAGLKLPGFHDVSRHIETTPERMVAAIQALGPTFVKLGQVLSTRPDVLPPAYIEALQTLQDDVSPLPFDVIRRQLESALGRDWADGFQDHDPELLATGSIAQVHRARLKTGQEVVVKVLRPGIREKIRADVSILNLLSHRLLVEFPEAAFFDPNGILREFERSMRDETDLSVEAANAQRFRLNFEDDEHVFIPRIYPEFTTTDTLVMDFVSGFRIRDARAAGVDMTRVGEVYLEAAYRMLFDHGFFHGDLHPGNVFVMVNDPSAGRNGHEGESGPVRLGLIDFGMVGRLTPDMKDNLVTILFALERGDFRSIARIYFDLGIKTSRVDYEAFERDVIDVMERNWVGRTIQEVQIGRFLKSLADGAIRYRVRAPPTYTMFFKAVLTTEGLAKSLIPEVDPVTAARPFIGRLVRERFAPERLREEMFYAGVSLRILANRLPATVGAILGDIEHGRLRLRARVTNVQTRRARRATQRRLNQTVVAGMSMASLIAGSLALYMDSPMMLGLPWVSWILFASSLAFWLWTLALIVLSGRA